MAQLASVVSTSLCAGALVVAAVAACSGTKAGSGFESSSSGSTSGGASSSGTGSSSGGGSSSGVLGSSSSSGGPSDAACAEESALAQQQPLDMYIMLDQSGSMNQQNKWTNVTGALKSFFTQPSAAGIGVGLQYFGLGGGPFTPSSCNAADYAKPEVEIAALPGSANALTSSLGGHGPLTDTPTIAALQGAVDHAGAWASAHAGHVTIAVLATDGDPSSSCDDNLADINAVAQKAATGTPKILTFVIGVGTSLTALNGIANAGGTNQAFIVDPNGNTAQQFLDALNKIRGTALGCTYQIPVPKGGGQLDFNTVNVKYTPSGGQTVTIPKVADKASCPASGEAWYYDNNAAPTQIILCDATCKEVAADSNAQVAVAVGCATVVR
jgi:hypothetical protein